MFEMNVVCHFYVTLHDCPVFGNILPYCYMFAMGVANHGRPYQFHIGLVNCLELHTDSETVFSWASGYLELKKRECITTNLSYKHV